jgi:putative ABC transport system permease protein
MRKSLNIIRNSLKLTFQELRVNKLRTALSLTGVAFGIFCIIGVLATVNSLERNIQNEVKSLGSNTIYIDKWDYSGGPDQPIWKFRARPVAKYEEAEMVKKRAVLLDDISYLMQTGSSISHKDDLLQSVSVYGIIEAQMVIQPLEFDRGRFFSASEFNAGSNVCLIGFTNAEQLFGNSDRALGKQVTTRSPSAWASIPESGVGAQSPIHFCAPLAPTQPNLSMPLMVFRSPLPTIILAHATRHPKRLSTIFQDRLVCRTSQCIPQRD